ncbi:MAG TPA: alkene reductase, partial [Nitrospiria bacterium]|nr:alkene reductase [Nitrospiria bacterium]
MTDLLFSSYKLGKTELKNRVVMAPMTRNRSTGNLPGELAVLYYSQRSEAGLIITEGTSPSANGLGYPRIPGLYSEEQKNAWKKVTDKVHQAGSRIFVQLMHTGRISHSLNLPAGARVLAPSPVASPEKMWTDQEGEQPFPVPVEMTEADIESTIEE